jgi:quinol-cytochrome oxidoreductase complex cytochrome b subunit
MFMFETLKLVPGGEVLGIEYEAIPILLFSLGGLLMMLVPFLDRKVNLTGKSQLFTFIGVVALVYIVGMTAWGYRSLAPLFIVVGTVVLMLLLGLATRHDAGPAEARFEGPNDSQADGRES